MPAGRPRLQCRLPVRPPADGYRPFGAGQPAGFFLRAVNRFPGAHGIASSHQRPVPAYRIDRKFQRGRLRGCLAQIHRNFEPGGDRACSSTPVYLFISNDGAEIRDASPYWGLDAFETQDRIAADLAQEKLQILSIGTAGESGARFACIVTGRDHAAGRTGLGAVMGAKRLKAVVIQKGGVKPFDDRRQLIGSAVNQYVRQIKASPDFDTFSRFGGAGYIKWADDMGVMGTRNYRQQRFEMIDRVDGRQLIEDKVRSSGCFRCPVQCKADLKFKDGPMKDQTATRPEFEPMINLGSKCGLGDLQAVVHLDNLCTRLGLDSTSASTAIAFAMDLFDRGILTEADTGGMPLAWGDAAAMETLIRQMAAGEGLGGILAQGVRRAAEAIGGSARQLPPTSKGWN
jgi:aldehyde:ferredoxin oxidoreductase